MPVGASNMEALRVENDKLKSALEEMHTKLYQEFEK